MAKYTDAIRDVIIAAFNAGDQPTEAQFTNWITRVQEGIEEHDHSGTGDGDGVADLVGPVGIGVAAPRGALDVAGSVIVGAHDGDDLFFIERYSAAIPDAQFQCGFADNDVPVGLQINVRDAAGTAVNAVKIKTTGAVQFQIGYGAGDVQSDANGNLGVVSDVRLKIDIEPLKGGLKEVLQLQGRRWRYTEESGLDTEHWYQGFIADDVEKVIPGAVGLTNTGMKTMSYSSLMPALAKAIQELDERLRRLE